MFSLQEVSQVLSVSTATIWCSSVKTKDPQRYISDDVFKWTDKWLLCASAIMSHLLLRVENANTALALERCLQKSFCGADGLMRHFICPGHYAHNTCSAGYGTGPAPQPTFRVSRTLGALNRKCAALTDQDLEELGLSRLVNTFRNETLLLHRAALEEQFSFLN